MNVENKNGRIEIQVPEKKNERKIPPGFMGRKFEQLCKSGSSDSWCAVLVGGFDENSILMGAEIDACSSKGQAGHLPPLDKLLELKTNAALETEEKIDFFRRKKLLDTYLQAFLVGVPNVGIGYRSEAGKLDSFEFLPTRSLPKYSGEQNFDPWILFKFLRNVLRSLRESCIPGKRYQLILKRPFQHLILAEIID